MPREQRTRIKQNHTPVTPQSNQRLSAVATPVDRLVEPPQNGISALSEALSKASPSFKRYLENKQRKENEKDNARAVKEAKVLGLSDKEINEKIALGELQPEDSPVFESAFMKTTGFIAGQRKAKELEDLFSNGGFDLESGDFNVFLGDNLKDSIEGIQDEDYLTGYLQALEPTEGKLKAAQQEFTQDKINEKRQTGLLSIANAVFQAAVDLQLSPDELSSQLEGSVYMLGDQLHIPRSSIDDLTFKAAEAIADSGNPEVLDVFDLNKPDGTPGLANNPRFVSQLSNAKMSALRTKVQNEERLLKAEEREQKLRTKRIERDVLDLFEVGELSAATRLIDKYSLNDTLEPNFIRTMRNAIKAQTKEEAEEKLKLQDEATIKAVTLSIYDGTITSPLEILTDLYDPDGSTPGTLNNINSAQEMMKLWKEVNDPDSIFKTSSFKELKDFVKRSLTPQRSPFGLAFTNANAPSLQAKALLEFSRKASKLNGQNINFEELESIADDVVKRWKPSLNDNSERPIAPNIDHLKILFPNTVEGLQKLKEAGPETISAESKKQLIEIYKSETQ